MRRVTPVTPQARTPDKSRLLTPAKAAEFYETAFRELQVLERDLLERGPWKSAVRRIEALQARAEDYATALGPAARSGDRDFQSALKRVQRVQSYLERIVPMLNVHEVESLEPREGVLQRLGRLWRRDED